jgi:methionine sulfoxide reductase heme-binding subunit
MAGGANRMIVLAVVQTSTTSGLWYATRASGAVDLVLLSGAVVLGLLTASRTAVAGLPRFVTGALHRNVSLLALAFLAVHVLTAVADPFAHIGKEIALVPFATSYRPLWLGLGTVAGDLMIAVIVTSLVRVRLGHRLWRLVHWTVYATWAAAMLHTLGAGTDVRQPWMLAVIVACTLAVLVALMLRLRAGWPELAGVRVAAGLVALALPVAVLPWVRSGPLAPGWARRAGTPASLLVAGQTNPRTGLAAPPYDGRVAGTVMQTSNDATGLVTVHIRGTTTDPSDGVLDVRITGQPVAGGGVEMTAGQVRLGTAGQPGVYQGDIIGLEGGLVTAHLRAAGLSPLRVTLDLTIGPSSVSGRLRAVEDRGAS